MHVHESTNMYCNNKPENKTKMQYELALARNSTELYIVEHPLDLTIIHFPSYTQHFHSNSSITRKEEEDHKI